MHWGTASCRLRMTYSFMVPTFTRNGFRMSQEAYRKKGARPGFHRDGLITLATSYFRTTYRGTIIGAAAFHFRVRNGNGWCHCAIITRTEPRMPRGSALAMFEV